MSPTVPDKNHGIKRATDHVRAVIAAGANDAQECLPSLKHLAQSAGVSPATMWKAVKSLQGEGLIRRLASRRLAPVAAGHPGVEPPGASVAPVNEPQSRCLACARRMERDILAGRFGAGPRLPALKELIRLYRVNYRTLKKALGILAGRGILREDGAMGPVATARASSSRVVVLAHGWGAGELGFGYLDDVFLPILEDLASQFSVTIDICIFDEQDGRLKFARPLAGRAAPFRDPDAVLGYLYPVTSPLNVCEELMLQLSASSCRAAIVDGIRGWSPPAAYFADPKRKLFAVADSVRGAQDVARHLIALGHRRAAYFSPYNAAAWSRSRATAIDAAFRAAGRPCAALPFVIDREDIRDYGEKCRAFDYPKSVEKISASLKRELSSLPRTYGQRIDRFLRHHLRWEFIHTEVECAMEPLCEDALRDDSITAWIAANDETAVILLDFLERRGVKVPRQLSVISFDNFHEAARRRLTSYDFNVRAVLHAALTFLVHTAEFTDLRRKSVIEMQGMLVERESVRRVTAAGDRSS